MMTTTNERRQHFRIEDKIFFDYHVIKPGEIYSDTAIINQLIGENGKKFIETRHFFQNIDTEIAHLTKSIGKENSEVVQCLNLLSAKIDFLFNQYLLNTKLKSRKVSISLGGIAFATAEPLPEHAMAKIVLYAKPMMVPIIIDGRVVYSKPQDDMQYRTAFVFTDLTSEHEEILSQHILFAQIKNRAV